MMNRYAIVFDVGGTAIKAAVVTEQGEVMEDTVETYSAYSNQSKSFLLDYFFQLIQKQAAKIEELNFEIIGIGYAYPSPCDFDRGISYIQGQQKYDALYGVSLLDEMKLRVDNDRLLRSHLIPEYRIVFDNDARLFGVGQLFVGHARNYDKSLCITIGTGTGAAFIDHGQAIKNKEIYDHPFRASIVDDYISKRGILKIASELGLDSRWDVKEIADAAHRGNELAATVFIRFGQMFGEVLERYIDEFGPQAVIIGGQIAKAGELYIPHAKSYLGERSPDFATVQNSSHSTFAGITAKINGFSD